MRRQSFTSNTSRCAATRLWAFCWRCFWAALGFTTSICGGRGWAFCMLCFCWTPFPWVLGFIECFFMPGRVREFNAIQAAGIAAALGIPMPAYGVSR